MYRSAVFLEFIDEAESFLQFLKDNQLSPNNMIIIGMTPKVQVFLKEHGINCDSTLICFDNNSHEKALLESERLVRWIRENFHFEDNIGIKEGYDRTFVFYVRLVIHHLLWLLEIIHNVTQRHKISLIYACIYKNKHNGNPYITVDERYLGLMAKSSAMEKGLKFQEIPFMESVRSVDGAQKTSISGFFTRRFLDKVSAHLYRLSFSMLKQRQPILVTSLSYRMNDLVEELQKKLPAPSWLLLDDRRRGIKGFVIAVGILVLSVFKKRGRVPKFGTHLNGIAPISIIQALVDKDQESIRQFRDRIKRFINKVEAQNGFFRYQEIEIHPVLINKIGKDLLPYMLDLLHRAEALRYIMERLSPELVLSLSSVGIHYILGELCRLEGIPALLISHGSHVRPKNRLEEIELYEHGLGLINTAYPYSAIQSPHAEGYADYFNIRSERIRTAPLLWGRMNSIDREITKKRLLGVFNDKRVVVHAGTQKARHSRRLHIYETPDEYVQGLRDCVCAVNKVEDAILVIKFRPSDGLSLKDLKSLLPSSDRVVISVDEPFMDVLSFSDLLISFSSTTIEEALHNRVPVLMYGGNGRYCHIPGLELSHSEPKKRSATYFVRDAKDLGFAINWILKTHCKRLLTDEELRDHVFGKEDVEDIAEFIQASLNSNST